MHRLYRRTEKHKCTRAFVYFLRILYLLFPFSERRLESSYARWSFCFGHSLECHIISIFPLSRVFAPLCAGRGNEGVFFSFKIITERAIRCLERIAPLPTSLANELFKRIAAWYMCTRLWWRWINTDELDRPVCAAASPLTMKSEWKFHE